MSDNPAIIAIEEDSKDAGLPLEETKKEDGTAASSNPCNEVFGDERGARDKKLISKSHVAEAFPSYRRPPSHELAGAIPVITLKKPRTHVNHSYRDLSRVPPTASDLMENSEERTFAEKLHEVLSNDEYKHYISWMPHGRAFRVQVPKRFELKVSPKYFGHARYSSFLRQLNNHGFKHITQGDDRNCYYHEAFLRGLPHLCKYMPKPRNARRLIPDPDNEPNFYQIQKAFPLPDDVKGHEQETSEETNAPPQVASSSADAESGSAQRMQAVAPGSSAHALSPLMWPSLSLPVAQSSPMNAWHHQIAERALLDQHQRDIEALRLQSVLAAARENLLARASLPSVSEAEALAQLQRDLSLKALLSSPFYQFRK